MVIKYFAKENTWFKSGSECFLLADCGDNLGIFKGTRIKEHESENEDVEFGCEYEDEELCNFDEFETIKDNK